MIKNLVKLRYFVYLYGLMKRAMKNLLRKQDIFHCKIFELVAIVYEIYFSF